MRPPSRSDHLPVPLMAAGTAFMRGLLEQIGESLGMTSAELAEVQFEPLQRNFSDPVGDPMADTRAQILTADGWKPLAAKPTTREA